LASLASHEAQSRRKILLGEMARLWAKEAAPTSYSPYEPLESTATHPSPTGGGGAMAMAQPNDGRRDIFIVGEQSTR
jgi:hypothetical protein